MHDKLWWTRGLAAWEEIPPYCCLFNAFGKYGGQTLLVLIWSIVVLVLAEWKSQKLVAVDVDNGDDDADNNDDDYGDDDDDDDDEDDV